MPVASLCLSVSLSRFPPPPVCRLMAPEDKLINGRPRNGNVPPLLLSLLCCYFSSSPATASSALSCYCWRANNAKAIEEEGAGEISRWRATRYARVSPITWPAISQRCEMYCSLFGQLAREAPLSGRACAAGLAKTPLT